MTFEAFKAKITQSSNRLTDVPMEYLNEEGRKQRHFFADLAFLTEFCESFRDLDEAIELNDSGLFDEYPGRRDKIRQWAREEQGLLRF